MKSNIYVQIARDLGSVEDNGGNIKHYVGSGLKQIELHPIEYVIWKSAGSMESIENWRANMSEKIKTKTRVPFEKIEMRLLQKNVLHPLAFTSIDEPQLMRIFVTRNGFAYGQREENWVVSSQQHDKKFRLESQLEYNIWIAASNYSSLLEIVLHVKDTFKYSIEQALQIVINATTKFIRTGMWTAEYIEMESN